MSSLPTAQEQLRFLKNIQQIIQLGSFTSTYKFALLMSLTRLAIELGKDNGDRLVLDYTALAEKFIGLYWQQTTPFQFKIDTPFILQQNTGSQATVVQRIAAIKSQYKTLAALKRNEKAWTSLVKEVARVVKDKPAKHLQNINQQDTPFLYQYEECQKQLILLPKVMYNLRQFSEIIDELCQKRWIDYIRHNKKNLSILDGLPDLEQFMFTPSRNQLQSVAKVLLDIQDCQCFYCQKSLKNTTSAVDHFIPWSLYSSDTGHNFVLADSQCNRHKSNFLASQPFLEQWVKRNEEHNQTIQTELGNLGFLTDIDRTHNIAKWAYQQAAENQYALWDTNNTTGLLMSMDNLYNSRLYHQAPNHCLHIQVPIEALEAL